MQCKQCKRWSWGLPKQVLQGTGTWTSTVRVRPGLKHWHRQWWIAADFCDRLHSNQVLYNEQWILRFLKNNIYFNIWMSFKVTYCKPFQIRFFCSCDSSTWQDFNWQNAVRSDSAAVKNLFTIRCSIITNRHSWLTTGAQFCKSLFGKTLSWPPYVTDADIIFSSCFFFLLLSYFPRLISAVAD